MIENHFAQIEIMVGVNKGWKGEAIICTGNSFEPAAKFAIKADRQPWPDGTVWHGDTEYKETKFIKAT